jgi:hypothetical protein
MSCHLYSLVQPGLLFLLPQRFSEALVDYVQRLVHNVNTTVHGAGPTALENRLHSDSGTGKLPQRLTPVTERVAFCHDGGKAANRRLDPCNGGTALSAVRGQAYGASAHWHAVNRDFECVDTRGRARVLGRTGASCGAGKPAP